MAPRRSSRDDEPVLLYKFKPSEPLGHIVDILLEQRLYCASYLNLNDPFEGQFLSVRTRRMDIGAHQTQPRWIGACPPKDVQAKSVADLEDRSRHLVCSLSTGIEDVRMWSLYASGHSGVAIEIEFADSADLHEVTYHDRLTEQNHGNPDPLNSVDVLTRKTKHWDYEQEHRLLFSEEYYSIRGQIRRVVLGAHASPALAKLMRRIVDDDIGVVKAKLDVNGVGVIH